MTDVKEMMRVAMKLAPWPAPGDTYAERDKYVGRILDAALEEAERHGYVLAPRQADTASALAEGENADG